MPACHKGVKLYPVCLGIVPRGGLVRPGHNCQYGDMTENATPAPYVGMVFDTEFESDCTVTAVGERGNFLAIDSDGVECEFHVSMIRPSN